MFSIIYVYLETSRFGFVRMQLYSHSSDKTMVLKSIRCENFFKQQNYKHINNLYPLRIGNDIGNDFHQ